MFWNLKKTLVWDFLEKRKCVKVQQRLEKFFDTVEISSWRGKGRGETFMATLIEVKKISKLVGPPVNPV
jgi:hypothetical protein